MRKLDVYYHCKPNNQDNGEFKVENVTSVENINVPVNRIPMQIDIVKSEIENDENGNEVIKTSTTKYTIGTTEQTAKVLKEVKEDEGRFVITPYRTKMLSNTKVEKNKVFKDHLLSPTPVLYKDYCYPAVAIFELPNGKKQIYAKTADVKVFSIPLAMRKAFISDVIDYLGEQSTKDAPSKTYSKYAKYKSHSSANNQNK